jgi:hypothetical protein
MWVWGAVWRATDWARGCSAAHLRSSASCGTLSALKRRGALSQGISAQQHPLLTKAIAYAAGRYGHVMFPENTHAPALSTAQVRRCTTMVHPL